MPKLRCPVCKKTLTKREYEAALGILEAREKHLHGETDKLRQKLMSAQAKLKDAVQEGRKSGIELERKRTNRLLAGKDRSIQTLQDRIRQLKRGTTPQTEGLEFEDELTARLEREFPDDKIIPKGKGGDVLQIVMIDKREAGKIIYECKRTPRISGQHVRQAATAKQYRQADFAVVVTTGTRKGFNGLAQVAGVLIVAPLGVIHLTALLRTHLIEIVKANVVREKRAQVGQKLLKYITSPQFRNPIEEIVQTSSDLQEMILEEARDHQRIWQRRWNHYQRIQWDSTQIGSNINLVLHGKEPKSLTQPKSVPLQLPAPRAAALAAKSGS